MPAPNPISAPVIQPGALSQGLQGGSPAAGGGVGAVIAQILSQGPRLTPPPQAGRGQGFPQPDFSGLSRGFADMNANARQDKNITANMELAQLKEGGLNTRAADTNILARGKIQEEVGIRREEYQSTAATAEAGLDFAKATAKRTRLEANNLRTQQASLAAIDRQMAERMDHKQVLLNYTIGASPQITQAGQFVERKAKDGTILRMPMDGNLLDLFNDAKEGSEEKVMWREMMNQMGTELVELGGEVDELELMKVHVYADYRVKDELNSGQITQAQARDRHGEIVADMSHGLDVPVTLPYGGLTFINEKGEVAMSPTAMLKYGSDAAFYTAMLTFAHQADKNRKGDAAYMQVLGQLHNKLTEEKTRFDTQVAPMKEKAFLDGLGYAMIAGALSATDGTEARTIADGVLSRDFPFALELANGLANEDGKRNLVGSRLGREFWMAFGKNLDSITRTLQSDPIMGEAHAKLDPAERRVAKMQIMASGQGQLLVALKESGFAVEDVDDVYDLLIQEGGLNSLKALRNYVRNMEMIYSQTPSYISSETTLKALRTVLRPENIAAARKQMKDEEAAGGRVGSPVVLMENLVVEYLLTEHGPVRQLLRDQGYGHRVRDGETRQDDFFDDIDLGDDLPAAPSASGSSVFPTEPLSDLRGSPVAKRLAAPEPRRMGNAPWTQGATMSEAERLSNQGVR